MKNRISRSLAGLCLLSFSSLSFSQSPVGDLINAIPARNIGPTNMGGRIMEMAIVEKDPRIMYVATASGGLWKTVNAGITFEPVFDRANTVSLGAVAVDQKNPDHVWVGTGEASSRNSTAWGDGVYKSEDGGKTWKHMGLTETRHIVSVIIDPKNPNNIYVGATGRLWGPSEERGVFKSTDGGKTWTKQLYVNDLTGVADMVMDPKNPNVLVAAMWERLRKPYDWKSGGDGSGLYKTTNGGKTWRKITKGLPPGPMGRIGLDVFHKNPKVMIATVEYRDPAPTAPTTGSAMDQTPARPAGAAGAAAGGTRPAGAAGGQGRPAGAAGGGQQGVTTNTQPTNIRFNGGGVFRSTDGGESWTKVNNLNPRPFYFSNPRQDPQDENTMYVAAVSFHVSTDKGATFRVRNISVHADIHDLWINPADSNHMIIGCDGGMYESRDKGMMWRHLNTMPLGQFYAVAFDMRRPYWIYGGLQDNGSWGTPTQTSRGGVTYQDAVRVGGGDGFHVQVDPEDPMTLYSESQGGVVSRWDLKSGAARMIRPRGEGLRWNWSTPILLSPHNSKIVYVGGNRLFRSLNRGDVWEAISPDLTTNDPTKLRPGRDSVTPEDTGAERHCTIITISESPMKAGLIYVGTDDGLVHVTENGGVSWTNLTSNIPDLPANTWCSRVLASKWVEGRVYATFDGHRSNDFKPYVYVSEDYGKTWSKLHGELPDYDSVYVITEGTQNPDLLLLGSEMSLRMSLDRGKTWHRYTGLPTVAIHDLKIHPRELDLVIGTHGRSIWTANISALEQLTAANLEKPIFLCTPQDVLKMGFVTSTPWDGDQVSQSRNTQPGTTIYYHLKEAASSVSLAVTDVTGATRFELQATGKKGLNAVTWNGRIGGRVAPAGDYRVVLKVGDVETVARVRVALADGVSE